MATLFLVLMSLFACATDDEDLLPRQSCSPSLQRRWLHYDFLPEALYGKRVEIRFWHPNRRRWRASEETLNIKLDPLRVLGPNGALMGGYSPNTREFPPTTGVLFRIVGKDFTVVSRRQDGSLRLKTFAVTVEGGESFKNDQNGEYQLRSRNAEDTTIVRQLEPLPDDAALLREAESLLEPFN